METAKIYTYTILRSSTPAFIDKIPYCSSILESDDGSRFAALLDGYVDGMSIEIGRVVKKIGNDEKGNPVYSLVQY